MSALPQEVLPPAAVASPNSLLQVIARAAADPTVDIEKMERLMAMHERLIAREAETAFNDAMTACQHEMRAIAADAYNPQTKSKYPTYAALDRVLRPIYTRHGFSISYDTADSTKAEHVRVLAYVARGGYTRTYTQDMPADGKGAKGGDVMSKTHATGSANTYGQRYLLGGIFNVVISRDDDGNAASAGPAITEEQAVILRDLILAANADEAKFCVVFKIDALSEMPAKRFEEARTRLQVYAKKQQAAE